MRDSHIKPKIVVIVGPTASGKSALAVKLAKCFSGEIVSADSRQVYRGLDIGTGKITMEEMEGIPHHMLDVAEPNERYTVQDFKRDAKEAVQQILQRKKLPIVVGGTGFYIAALIDNLTIPEIPPNQRLREELSHKTTEELFAMLEERDPKRAGTIEQSNRRRLIRALEIVEARGAVPSTLSTESDYDPLFIGVALPDDTLKERIKVRLAARVEQGMKEEARKLHQEGLSYERMEELGLEYRYLARYLQGILNKEEFFETLATKIWQYARRQKTWFKRDRRIQWHSPSDFEKIAGTLRAFLS